MEDGSGPRPNSPLVQRIREAIMAHSPFSGILHVSVADEPKWERSHAGDSILVRWMCWNLEDNGVEVTDVIFEVLSKDVTRERLAHDLTLLFPGVEVRVDNAIEA